MRKIEFTKMVASGNDFIVIESKLGGRLAPLARYLCDRKFGIGADGLLLLEESKKADVKMRIINADGSEAEMCGNGARCVSLYKRKKQFSIETKAGLIDSQLKGDKVKIKLTGPVDIKLDMPIKINERSLKVNFVNTGVPHTVIFVSDINRMDVVNLGGRIRYHKSFTPKGTNVNFAEVLSRDSIRVRTYERGVEDETLSCGTGSVASAVIFALKSGAKGKIIVQTQGGESLSVYFNRQGDKFGDVWLEGKAKVIFRGSLGI